MASELNVGAVTATGGKVTVGDSSANELLVGFESSSQDYSIGANGNFFMVCANATDLDANQLLTISSTGQTAGTGSLDGDWVFKTTNSHANGYGAVVIAGGSTSSQTAFEVRKNTSDTAFKVDCTGLATFSAGIAFSSQTESTTGTPAAINVLNHYETGTWTPVLTGVTGAGATGYYTRIGNLVQISYYSGAFTGTAVSATITGLPFNAGSYQVFTGAHNTWVPLSSSGYFNSGLSSLTFTNPGTTTGATAAAGGGKYLMLSGTYTTNA